MENVTVTSSLKEHFIKQSTSLYIDLWQEENNSQLQEFPYDRKWFDENKTSQLENSTICGVPGFCSISALKACTNTTIKLCSQCGVPKTTAYLFLVILLGLSILVGNALILWVCVSRSKKKAVLKNDICRSSLAVADLLTGINVFIVVISNFSWTYTSTIHELDVQQLKTRSSPQAFVGGIFYLFSMTSSLYHLIFIAMQRLYSIKMPMKYKSQGNQKLYVQLAIVWILAAASSTMPAWFPDLFTFSLQVTTLLYFPTSQTFVGDSSFVPPLVLMIFLLVIPYIVLTFLTAGLYVFVRPQLQQSRALEHHTQSSKRNKQIDRKELSVLKTSAVMQLGFTITLFPIMIASGLFHAKVLRCSNLSSTYMICAYLSMFNSVINVLIYSVMDKSFRASLKDIVIKICSRKAQEAKRTSTVASNKTSF